MTTSINIPHIIMQITERIDREQVQTQQHVRQLLHRRQSLSMPPESAFHWPAIGFEAGTLSYHRPPTSQM